MTVDKSPTRVRRMFGEIAQRYDRMNHLLSLGIDKYWRWRTVRSVPPNGGGPILDLATGTGDLAIAYRKAAGADGRVVGADFCHEMLVLGRRKGATVGAEPGITFVEADALALPFPDNCFQIVSIAFGLRNVSDTRAGLAEMARVCRPGGRVAVLEFSMPQRQPFRAAYGWYFRRVLPRIGQLLARNRSQAYNYLPTSVDEFPLPEMLAEMMRSLGLRDVRYEALTLGVATLHVGVK